MKSILLTGLLSSLLLALVSSAGAATVSIVRGSPGSNAGLQLANYATQLPYENGGYAIAIGTFNIAPVTRDDLQGFIEFAAGLSPTSGPARGYISGSFTRIVTEPSDFSSKEIFILAGNGPTLATSTETIVLRSAGAPWLFPPSMDAASNTTIIALRTNVTGVFIDTMPTLILPQPEGADFVAMGPLTAPEPASSLLAFLGLAILNQRHHRR